jgi:CRP-like cAMP-binding protein
MYIIKSGIVRVTRQKGTETAELAILSVGEFFGEIGLFRDVLRTATAAALKPAVLFELKRDKFHDFLKEKPQFAVKILYYMLGEMSKRLRLKNREEEFIIF